MGKKLSDRQRIEERYHDEKFRGSHISQSSGRHGDRFYEFFWEQLEDVAGLDILDFGCGDGWVSVKLAREGAKKVCGIDISSELIAKGRNWIEREGLASKISFEKMAGENLTFPDNSFDLVLGSAVLHHTDMDLAIRGIRRVLKPGARGLFIEPMNQNIFLKIWRKLTPWRRSPAEKALTNADLNFIKKVFPGAKFHFFGFIAIFSKGLIICSKKSKILHYFDNIFESIDHYLINVFPFLGKYCAVVVLELKK